MKSNRHKNCGTKFHDFSVYLISGTWKAIWDFSRDLKGSIINVRVTMGVH
jgi:hypothetical protein